MACNAVSVGVACCNTVSVGVACYNERCGCRRGML